MNISTALICIVAGWCTHEVVAAQDSPANAAATDHHELAQLYAEDQSDREPKEGKGIDWPIVGPRDEARRKRIMEFYAAGELKTGKDYYHAGMILQHGNRPEDYLLCHELCVAAVFTAPANQNADWISQAKWLAAASEDRFLLSVGRAQRFGTQFGKEGNSPWKLKRLEEGITDELRKALNVPPLAKAKEREAELNK
jgi:hypothetical protein